jgi:hypothetical protein
VAFVDSLAVFHEVSLNPRAIIMFLSLSPVIKRFQLLMSRYNWARDVTRWMPSLLPSEVHVVATGKKTPLNDFRVIVISYDLFARRFEDFMKLPKPIGVAIMVW